MVLLATWAVLATVMAALATWKRRRADADAAATKASLDRLEHAAVDVFLAGTPALFTDRLHALRAIVADEAQAAYPFTAWALRQTEPTHKRVLAEMAWPTVVVPRPSTAMLLAELLTEWKPTGNGIGPRRFWATGETAALVYETMDGKWLYRVSDPWREEAVIASTKVATEADAMAAADAVLRAHVERWSELLMGAAAHQEEA